MVEQVLDTACPCCEPKITRMVFNSVRQGCMYQWGRGCGLRSQHLERERSFDRWSQGRLSRWRIPGWKHDGTVRHSEGFFSAGKSSDGEDSLYTDMTLRYLQRFADIQRLESDANSCQCIWWASLGVVIAVPLMCMAAVPEEDVSIEATVAEVMCSLVTFISSITCYMAVVWQSEKYLQTTFVFGVWQLAAYGAYFGWVATHASTVSDVCGPSNYDFSGSTAAGCFPARLRYLLRIGLSAAGFAVAVLQAKYATALWDTFNDDWRAETQTVFFRYIQYWANQLESDGKVLQVQYQRATGREWDHGALQRDLFANLTQRISALEGRTDTIVFSKIKSDSKGKSATLSRRDEVWAESVRRRRIAETQACIQLARSLGDPDGEKAKGEKYLESVSKRVSSVHHQFSKDPPEEDVSTPDNPLHKLRERAGSISFVPARRRTGSGPRMSFSGCDARPSFARAPGPLREAVAFREPRESSGPPGPQLVKKPVSHSPFTFDAF
eukprot:Hpha_TRINITY_DN10393_c0_g1::TRINITY_DN10393_c0_g1_i1::g.116132::m.116132